MSFFSNIMERVRRLFGRTAFQNSELASTFITDEMATAIDRWAHLYANKAPWLEKHEQSIGLPSSIAREISTLVTLEMQATVSDPNSKGDQEETSDAPTRAGFIEEVFNGIMPQIQVHTEYACALGGIVFKPYVSDGTVAIDYVQADDFYPITFNSRGEIRSAIFMERKRTAHEFFTRMERHDITNDDYIITNRAFRSYADNDIGTEIPLAEVEEWADIQPETHIANVDFPLFAYFKIPQGNVVDKHSQLGVSVYARADSSGLLKEADKQWQRFMWEYEGGELAIDASIDAFKNVKAKDGSVIPVLPVGKERLYRMNGLSSSANSNNTADLMKVFAPSLRDSNFGEGLNNILMRIEDACGLARGTFSDVNDQVRTATELKISRQRSYATVTSIQRSLERALNTLAEAIDALATLYNLAPAGEYSIAYVWDDSIVVDADAEREKDRTDVHDGLMLPWEYRVKWYGETEEKAKAVLAEANGETDDEIMGFKKRLEEPEVEE